MLRQCDCLVESGKSEAISDMVHEQYNASGSVDFFIWHPCILTPQHI